LKEEEERKAKEEEERKRKEEEEKEKLRSEAVSIVSAVTNAIGGYL
jgi:hypothetical protein